MLNAIVVITIAVFGSRAFSVVSGNCPRITTFVANQNWQKSEEAQVVMMIRANSATQCSLFCLHHIPVCQSFHYNRGSKSCELLENIKQSEVNVNSQVAYTLKPTADCCEMQRTSSKNIESGMYLIGNVAKKKLFMYCDMKTDEGGWMVFQRRSDNSVNFYRPWVDYKKGFGDICGEFWLGNDVIHEITSSGSGEFKLRLDVQATTGETYFATYEAFIIADEDDKYRMSLGSWTDGNQGNFLAAGHGEMFTTKDNDNDDRHGENCADMSGGGWWFHDCFSCMLNGYYETQFWCLVNNNDWKPLSWSEMKIRQE